MATLSSTGRFASGEACADNDILYGPYATKSAAHAALLAAEQNVIGRTVGIEDPTTHTVEEYWYQGVTTEQYLVKKQVASVEVDDELSSTSENPVQNKVVKTALDAKANASAIANLATKSELSSGLAGKQDTINANNKVGSDFVDDTNGTNKFVTSTEKGLINTAVQNITRGGSTLTKENGVVVIPEEIADVAATPVAAGGNPTVDLTNGTLTLGIPRGADAVNPFKGWYDSSSNLPANPVVGDYAYVEDNGTTYVYRCTTAGSWPSTSIEEKEPSSATFATAQLLNFVKIDDTNLVNPVGSDETNNPTLAKAEDVMQLKAKLAKNKKQTITIKNKSLNLHELRK